MAKIIYWHSTNKPFKLTSWYIRKLKELGINNLPQNAGEYDNSDIKLIESVELLRKEIPNILQEELYQYINHQSVQSHFVQVCNNFESFAIRFWINVLEENSKLLETANIERLYNGIVYGYSLDELNYACKEWNIKLSNDMQTKFQALIVRREVVNDLREKRDKSHDKYLKFCADVGMRTFSHIPPNDGFKIVEYDETKYRAEISIQTSSLGFKYEELELLPI